MKTAMTKIAELLLELLPIIALGAFGGLTRTLAGKRRGEPYKWSIAIPEIIIAVFSGLLVHWVLSDFAISPNLKTAAIALAGYSARGVINLFNSLFLDRLNKIP